MKRTGRRLAALFPVLLLTCASVVVSQGSSDRLRLGPCKIPGTNDTARCGIFTVFENRATGTGRNIDLNLVVIPARSANPRPDPVVWLAGGPGAAATRAAPGIRNAWFRADRDIVLVDQRGTGASNPLDCELHDSDDLQFYLDPLFRVEIFEPCRDKLAKAADLSQYTTPIAMDDLNEVRAALGYEKINLMGGSYGSRAALIYMRRHPETVRSAILEGVTPIAFRNPLYHAYEAQRALEEIFRQCAADPACGAAFPDLREEFDAVIARLEAQPARVTFTEGDTGERVELELSRYGFAEALRTTLYYMPGARDAPLLIHRAYQGDYEFFVRIGLRSNIGITNALALGMLLSVTCPEDLARIDPGEIPALTDGTFLGPDRVRNQMAVCAIWPAGDVPEGYGEPVAVDVPTLIFSGTLDPVTPPRWGDETARHLPNSLHVVAPGAHGLGGSCITGIERQFLETASVEGIDTSCVKEMSLPPFRTQ
ncbi:MAG: alpha/beta fold hydrolase [Gemmatimonadetes bacterium]|uniref:Proline iminopeptidase n=1 Tax=Candidatus Kutchimonas denitrificans TaxID=3056748 RepID=A0AAE5CD46_9BACT|nr:alpha/beta fold hydrolase [Gemmatimonadota bacterium]NIR75089.1 alpha/beta fold hydrolase [Candidatus Kutchimonas denitrificans]NIS00921.1 alpha/beta fold hydrolase [Gemmatimonadota bacterium]NIT66538.1 alpha/beta fold hydrolase [Gemmatimonadota bacterium]NIU52884.1 alpha/beta fold hydrolase [Gemmatimonadota bacterium]